MIKKERKRNKKSKQKEELKMKKENGMTIIAGIITTIVLLIVAVITVYLILGNTGLLQRSKEKGNVYEQEPINQTREENVTFQNMDAAKGYRNLVNQM